MRNPQFMARVQRIQEAASGRWLDILIDAGLPEVMLLRLNRPCPLCGGRDRFSFYRNKPDGHWFCRGCGYGDGLSLLQKWRSERFTDTLVYLERVLGLPEYKRQDTGPDSVQTAEAAAKKRRQDRIEAVWKEAQALSKVPPSDPVRLYLASRGLYCGSICELRSHPLLDYWEELDDGDRTHKRWPAMLALVTDDEGRIVTLHRTYLTPEGIKAPVEAPKKLYAGGARGGLIRLGEPSDVLGIAEVASHVMHAWRESASNKNRGVRITVSTSWFVPKAHTAFQWEPQIPKEEYERRVKLLRENMLTKSVTYNWHDSDTSYMEAVISRGDRRLCRVIETAWRKGEHLSAWEEYFSLDRWLEAFEECGLDPHFYANRKREKDELMPWAMISSGVTEQYLWREHERCYQSVTTPDCRTHCNGCGANLLLGRPCDG